MDYSHNVLQLQEQRASNLYAEEGKDLWIEYRFWHPFHFDFYDHLVHHRFLRSKKGEPPILDMKYIDTYSHRQRPKLEIQQLVRDLKRMGA